MSNLAEVEVEAQEPKRIRLFYSEKKGSEIEVKKDAGETEFTTFGYPTSDMSFAPHDQFPFDVDSVQEIVLHNILTKYPKHLIVQILSECHHKLSPFGQIEIMVPNLKHSWLEGDLGHLTYIGPKSFETLSAFNPLKLDDPRTPIGAMTGMNLFMGAFREDAMLEDVPTQFWFKLVKVV